MFPTFQVIAVFGAGIFEPGLCCEPLERSHPHHKKGPATTLRRRGSSPRPPRKTKPMTMAFSELRTKQPQAGVFPAPGSRYPVFEVPGHEQILRTRTPNGGYLDLLGWVNGRRYNKVLQYR